MKEKLWEKKPENNHVLPDDSPRATTMALHDTVEDLPSNLPNEPEGSEVKRDFTLDIKPDSETPQAVESGDPAEVNLKETSSDTALKVDADDNAEIYSEIGKVGDSDNSEVYLTPTGIDEVRKDELHNSECNDDESVQHASSEELYEISKTMESIVTEVVSHVDNCSNESETIQTESYPFVEFSEPAKPSIVDTVASDSGLVTPEMTDTIDENQTNPEDCAKTSDDADLFDQIPSVTSEIAVENGEFESPSQPMQSSSDPENFNCDQTELPVAISDLSLKSESPPPMQCETSKDENVEVEPAQTEGEPDEEPKEDIAIIGADDANVMQTGSAIMDMITNGNLPPHNEEMIKQVEQLGE